MLVTSQQTWYLTEGGERVPAGHPEAAFLLINAGCLISEDVFERYPVKELKDAPQNKQIRTAPEDKGGKRRG